MKNFSAQVCKNNTPHKAEKITGCAELDEDMIWIYVNDWQKSLHVAADAETYEKAIENALSGDWFIWDVELETTIKYISIDNGYNYMTAKEYFELPENERLDWEVIADYMDDDTREAVHAEWTEFGETPEIQEAYLARYLELAPDDLIIG